MDKNSTSREARVTASSTRNRRLLWARAAVLALLLALALLGAQSKASTQAADQALQEEKANATSQQSRPIGGGCADCERNLVQCLGNGGGGSCYVQYNSCIETCD